MSHVFRTLLPGEAKAAMAIYSELKGSPGNTWTDDYPALDIVEENIAAGTAYGPFAGGTLVAVAAAEDDREMCDLPCWKAPSKRPCELCRVGVSKQWQRKGLARELLTKLEQHLTSQGFDSIRLLVGIHNKAAMTLYGSLGFYKVGEAYLYDTQWDCYEKRIG